MKRGVKDIDKYMNPEEIIELWESSKSLHYKTSINKYKLRDRTLLALLCLTGLRINEVLKLQKEQFDIHSDKDFVIIRDVEISKRRKEHILKDFGLPKTGRFEPMTFRVIEHLQTVKKGGIFKIKRGWAWQIIKTMTGKWCHFFRSQRISFLVNRLRSTVVAADMLGIKSPSTIAHYFKGGWEHHKKELL